MSNTQVGNVYQQVIADVVDSSRVDFEEGGVDEHVLEELKLVRLHAPPIPVLQGHVVFSISSLHLSSISILDCFRMFFCGFFMAMADAVLKRGFFFVAAACAQALEFSRVGDPLYLALYQPFACEISTMTLVRFWTRLHHHVIIEHWQSERSHS